MSVDRERSIGYISLTNNVILIIKLLADIHNRQSLFVREVRRSDDQQRRKPRLSLLDLLPDFRDILLDVWALLAMLRRDGYEGERAADSVANCSDDLREGALDAHLVSEESLDF